MLHNDAAQQRSGKKPASAPEASQKPPRAQERANLKILTPKPISSRPGDTTVAKPDGWKHGHTAHHPHPGQAQPAATIGPYAPRSQIHTTTTTWPGKNYAAKDQAPGPACTTPSLRGRTRASPLRAQRKAGQHSGYSNCAIHTLHTAEILQQANGGREEETRATTLCMAWHAQQEASSCATIPTDTGRRGHSASTTIFAAGGASSECYTNKAKQPKRDKVFLNTTHC